ncbi:LolA family protein [Psittacicella hinzii]|uniref:Outer membrane lipoprotein carrier protein LolA n=1 Tax=Psittacicella hinzii TaxID=2028575 RepID=A0A3A1YS05_9GAMM|nr:outer membrane lipoprotein carrier protein LolA [Psittacicella hinzii]RIY39710.1 hypothetical protein CKF58_01820 [Psittacicella hinzii]
MILKKILLTASLGLLTSWSWAFGQADLVKQLQQPTSLQGDFTQQRFLANLGSPITSTGDFTLVKAKGLLWNMQTPFPVSIRLNSKGISQWDGNQWIFSDQIGQSAQIKLFLGLLSGDVSGIENQFAIKVSGTAANWTMDLTPSSVLMKQIFTQITIAGGDLVKTITLQEKQGDKTVISFSQVKVDKPLNSFASKALP